jgi:hypothetical protein
MSTPSKLLPVNKSVFQALSEVNGSFEKLVCDVEALQQVSFFPSDKLQDYMNIICRLRAEMNLALLEAITEREMRNAFYYDRLCAEREQELKDPDDVLIEAELRKKEVAEEEQRLKEQETTPQESPM